MATTQAAPPVPVEYQAPRRRVRNIVGNVFIGVVLTVVMIWVLFPFYWAFLNSVNSFAVCSGDGTADLGGTEIAATACSR